MAKQKFRLVSKLTNALPEGLYMFFRNHTFGHGVMNFDVEHSYKEYFV